MAALRGRARRRGIPLARAASRRRPTRGGQEFLLVRPDQHIAWRAGDAADIDLDLVTGYAGPPGTQASGGDSVSSMDAGAAGKTAVTNVRVFDGRRLRPPGTVVIEGDRIGEGPTGTGRVPRSSTASGGVLLPGLIDAHVHVRDRTRCGGSPASA